MQHPYPASTKIVTALLFVFLFSCQKQYDVQLEQPAFSATGLTSTSLNLQGNVYDEKGSPASGAMVTVGRQNFVTDEKGYFRIEKAQVNANAPLVSVEKNGYFKTFRSFRITPGTNQLVIQLTKKEAIGNIAAATGGELSLQNGSKIKLAAGGIMYAATGLPYTGNVSVYASYIDPTSQDIGQTVPGSFMANDKDGNSALLQSYGMLAVELESSSGEKLQVASGKTATISTTIPSSLLSTAPATIPLWYVDEKTGLWQEEGEAIRNGNSYTGSVSHFTFWNCDKPITPAKLTASFKTADGLPLPGVSIKLTSKGAVNVSGFVYTDSLGNINELVPLGQTLLVEVQDPCKNVIYSEQLPTITGTTEKGTIHVTPNNAAVLTITGKLTGCAGKTMNGFAVVTINNMVHYAAADAAGNFSTRFIVCQNTGTVEVYGVDLTSFQRGNKTTLQAKAPVTDAGTLTACGTVIDEYMQYTMDGVSYKIADSINAYISQGNIATDISNSLLSNTIPGINGSYLAAGSLSFSVATGENGKTGTYSLPNVKIGRVGSYQVATVSKADVNFTAFPKKVNDYFEGTIDALFIDKSQQQHVLKGKFRMVRKR